MHRLCRMDKGWGFSFLCPWRFPETGTFCKNCCLLSVECQPPAPSHSSSPWVFPRPAVRTATVPTAPAGPLRPVGSADPTAPSGLAWSQRMGAGKDTAVQGGQPLCRRFRQSCPSQQSPSGWPPTGDQSPCPQDLHRVHHVTTHDGQRWKQPGVRGQTHMSTHTGSITQPQTGVGPCHVLHMDGP